MKDSDVLKNKPIASLTTVKWLHNIHDDIKINVHKIH